MRKRVIIPILTFFISATVYAGIQTEQPYTFKPENPVSSVWLSKHLSSQTPRLILTTTVEEKLIEKIRTDEVAEAFYNHLKKRGDLYLGVDLLERIKTGKRLLTISRKAIARISTLALLYRVEKDERYLSRLEAELNNVCDFEDWNPSHFLDVAEMAFAVSIGIDWCGAYLQKETVNKAKHALKEKALLASIKDPPYGWITSEHNWNQVCHGGLSAAAIVMAEDEPDLAAMILSRTLDNITYALVSYAPDGAFPEGPTYWLYATYYTTIMISMFESAFQTDFNLREAPGFMESARYSLLTIAPSAEFYNYFDAGSGAALSLQHVGLLSWFDRRDERYCTYDPKQFLDAIEKTPVDDSRNDRFSTISLIWLAQIEQIGERTPLPTCWIGRGPNPLGIIRGSAENLSGFYLAAKGGRASLNHGNMDAGSFIFELNGVRWSIDPGNQGYTALEKIMGNALWQRGQDAERWSLLTKNNFGHSTLTINDDLYDVDGYVPVAGSGCDSVPAALTFDMTGLFFGRLDKAVRRFQKKDEKTLLITDELQVNDSTKSVTWAMMTRAGIEGQPAGVLLSQEGHVLRLDVTSPDSFEVHIVPLDPPPLSYDKHIDDLKRIEIRILPSAFNGPNGKISVELNGIL